MNFLILIISVIVAVNCQDDSKSLNPVGCGKRLSDFPNKIVGGYKATVGDWGWQVGMNYNGRHSCGGAIINSLWMVTAAHCVDGRTTLASYFNLNFGYNNRLVANPWSTTRGVSKIIMHQNYSRSTFSNDIALMKFKTPITYSKYIVPACVPTVANVDYSGKLSWSTGWGTTSSGGSLSADLLEVVLPILTDAACKIKYAVPDSRTGFCAGQTGDNKDTCQGDSGGPLIVQDNNGENRGQWTLAGLTSYGRGCGDGGVVSRVSNYYNWMLNTINAN